MRRGRGGKRPTIGVLAGWQVYTGTLDTFLGQVLQGIRAAARDAGCDLLLACGVAWPDAPEVTAAWPLLDPEVDYCPVGLANTDGLIIVPPLIVPATARFSRRLLADGHPVVFAGAGEEGPAVMVDNEGGVRKAVQHLMGHGHRRIALLAGDESYPPQGDNGRRLAGYVASLQELGLPLDRRLIVHSSHTVAAGWQAMADLLDGGAHFTAVVAINDSLAQGALEALLEAGRKVPGDVAVVGFDDRLEARMLVPALTTVRHPMFEMGYQALTLLLRYIEGRAAGVEVIRIPTRLVIRESCGCLAGGSGSDAWTGQTQPALAAMEADDRPCRREEGSRSRVAAAMSAAVLAEVHRLSQAEVDQLCHRLASALEASLREGDPMIFRLAMQQVLRRVSSWGDDLHAWQAAVSVLREGLPSLLPSRYAPLAREQVEGMLDEARVAISEAARGQHTRHLIHQGQVAERVGQMTARFLAAQDEAEVFDVLAECLPAVGIERAAVVLYEGEGGDPAAWSTVRWADGRAEPRCLYPSDAFPPAVLCSRKGPYQAALLPLRVEQGTAGFVAFDAANLEPCAAIVRQLGAALRGAGLRREAVEGRRLAEEANRLKGRFLSVVSHELRTPLNLIAGLSDILLQEGEAVGEGRVGVRREDLERIYVSAQHLDGLIRDVLDLAQSEIGQLRLVSEPLDLAQVLQAVAVIGEHLARDRGLRWRAEIPDRLPKVWGDRTRLRQVVLNLINNAAKYTARGEISLTVSTDGASVRVAVHDTGLGIPLDEQEAIFDEFRQSERTTARGYGGLGLGLAICRRLVELHGGEIRVSSAGEEGAGSTFYFALPVLEQPPVLPGRVSLGPAQQVMLLVKDVEGGRRLQDHLAAAGFAAEICPVGDRTDWLAWLLADPPTAVVLDLGLASERGWQILKVLRESPATQGIPVLFYTLAGDEGSGSMLELDYLTKPVGITALARALASQGLAAVGGESQPGRSILLVDDEPEVLDMYARILQGQLPGYRILRAHGGRLALDLMRDERPDLVLLDLMMPEMDGFAVLDAMRAEEASRDIPVIVLTGQTLMPEDIARLNRGVASMLEKGIFTAEETLQHIEAALAGRREAGSETQLVIRKAVAYVHAHYAEPISRADVASHLGVSERHLSRCFRRETGMTLSTYLNRYRVRQARTLLEAGQRNITQVAMEVGFSTGGYFTRVFRREVGESPSAYMQRRCALRPASSGAPKHLGAGGR